MSKSASPVPKVVQTCFLECLWHSEARPGRLSINLDCFAHYPNWNLYKAVSDYVRSCAPSTSLDLCCVNTFLLITVCHENGRMASENVQALFPFTYSFSFILVARKRGFRETAKSYTSSPPPSYLFAHWM